ncbi:MAG: hypothetical protein F6K14_26940 [Symploca sp. SIO2C1]|nr:hypothetical protein [Symploca sp. SIO2C1]
MNGTTVERQALIDVVNALPDRALLELASFLDYLRYKNAASPQGTGDSSDFLLLMADINNSDPFESDRTEQHLQRQQELELLGIVQRHLPRSQQERWMLLRQKLEQETLTEREHQEFLTYSDLLESWNAQRVEAVMALAKLRGVEFKRLYQELTPQNTNL